jgi:release factor glutamine methyltransferase
LVDRNIFALTRCDLAKQLAGFGIEENEANKEAILILEHATGLTQTAQITSDKGELEPAWQDEIERILQGRQLRVPIQYILGKAYFMGLDLKVEPGVLIPRPDTEALVETVIDFSKRKGHPSRIGEIGVGAGPIAISLLKRLTAARIFACDISAKAIAVTSLNAIRHGVAERLELVEGDWRTALPRDFDAVVSNPPYVPLKQKGMLPREIAEHEPPAALFDEEVDGLGFFRAFAEILPEHLKRGSGWLAVEFGDGQSEAVTAIFQARAWREVKIHADIHGLPRVLTATVPF